MNRSIKSSGILAGNNKKWSAGTRYGVGESRTRHAKRKDRGRGPRAVWFHACPELADLELGGRQGPGHAARGQCLRMVQCLSGSMEKF